MTITYRKNQGILPGRVICCMRFLVLIGADIWLQLGDLCAEWLGLSSLPIVCEGMSVFISLLSTVEKWIKYQFESSAYLYIRQYSMFWLKQQIIFQILMMSNGIVSSGNSYLWIREFHFGFPVGTLGGRRSPAVACWASDHWVASSNPLRGKFQH